MISKQVEMKSIYGYNYREVKVISIKQQMISLLEHYCVPEESRNDFTIILNKYKSSNENVN